MALICLSARASEVYISWQRLYGNDSGELDVEVTRNFHSDGTSKGGNYHYIYHYRNTSKIAIKGEVVYDAYYVDHKDSGLKKENRSNRARPTRFLQAKWIMDSQESSLLVSFLP
jgi:hypothetical protein